MITASTDRNSRQQSLTAITEEELFKIDIVVVFGQSIMYGGSVLLIILKVTVSGGWIYSNYGL